MDLEGGADTGDTSSPEDSGALDGLISGVSEVDSPLSPPGDMFNGGRESDMEGPALGQALGDLSESDEFISGRRLSEATVSGRQRVSYTNSRRRSSGQFSEVSSSMGDDVARLSEVSMSGCDVDSSRLSINRSSGECLGTLHVLPNFKRVATAPTITPTDNQFLPRRELMTNHTPQWGSSK